MPTRLDEILAHTLLEVMDNKQAADIAMMERVLQNLVVNAVAHSRQGGRIVVSLEPDERTLVFTIRNEGQALADDILAWFNYKDLMPPANPVIGLSIVQRALAMHGFRFGAASNSGWNEFWFRMPVVR